jgi:hypothetical protein
VSLLPALDHSKTCRAMGGEAPVLRAARRSADGGQLCPIDQRTNSIASRGDRRRRARERGRDRPHQNTGGRPPVLRDRSGLARRSGARCATHARAGESHPPPAVRSPRERASLGHRSRAHRRRRAPARLKAPLGAAPLRGRRASPRGELRALRARRRAHAKGLALVCFAAWSTIDHVSRGWPRMHRRAATANPAGSSYDRWPSSSRSRFEDSTAVTLRRRAFEVGVVDDVTHAFRVGLAEGDVVAPREAISGTCRTGRRAGRRRRRAAPRSISPRLGTGVGSCETDLEELWPTFSDACTAAAEELKIKNTKDPRVYREAVSRAGEPPEFLVDILQAARTRAM